MMRNNNPYLSDWRSETDSILRYARQNNPMGLTGDAFDKFLLQRTRTVLPADRSTSPDENHSGPLQHSQSSSSGGGTKVLGNCDLNAAVPLPWLDSLNSYNEDPEAARPMVQEQHDVSSFDSEVGYDADGGKDNGHSPVLAVPLPWIDSLNSYNEDAEAARPIAPDIVSFDNNVDNEKAQNDSPDSSHTSSEEEKAGSRSSSPIPEGEYEVEEITDFAGGSYEVKWKGYSVEDNTWEPVTSLQGCNDKLLEFYMKRKREVDANSHKRNKKIKLEVPPDPRTLEVIIQKYFDDNNCNPSQEDILAKHHLIEKGSWKKRWSEEKLRQSIERATNGKLNEGQAEELLRQATFCFAQIASQKMQGALKKWESVVNGISQGCPTISIENTVDLTHPPTDFTYVNNYVAAQGVHIPQDPLTGCSCENDCRGRKTSCCPKIAGQYQSGAYYAKGLMRAPFGTPIYECNKRCVCSSKCGNRVVQDGVNPLRGKKMCIFKTPDCGWGVKTVKPIKNGSYVCLYVGEVITDEMANTRGKTYDQEGSTYLFDLDFNETESDNCPYVVDAKMFGNISHFFNHSCDPNLHVYGVWSDCLDPNLPMLALFACKDIPQGTELTFNYKSSQQATKITETRETLDTGTNVPLIKQKLCHCGSKNCRIFLF